LHGHERFFNALNLDLIFLRRSVKDIFEVYKALFPQRADAFDETAIRLHAVHCSILAMTYDYFFHPENYEDPYEWDHDLIDKLRKIADSFKEESSILEGIEEEYDVLLGKNELTEDDEEKLDHVERGLFRKAARVDRLLHRMQSIQMKRSRFRHRRALHEMFLKFLEVRFQHMMDPIFDRITASPPLSPSERSS